MRNFIDRKMLGIFLVAMILSVVTLSVAYAALNVTLNIVGSASVGGASWNVKLENSVVTSGSTSGKVNFLSNTLASFNADLNIPGDFYEFTVDIKNDGDVDAIINNVTISELSEEEAKYLTYTIQYENGDSIDTRELVPAKSLKKLLVRLEFKKDVNEEDLPKEITEVTMTFDVELIQDDGSLD